MFRSVFAYLDPGVGATLIQLVLAGTVGIGALIKLRWNSVKKIFGRDDEPVMVPEEVSETPH